jgi:hypothetical protein
MRTPADACRAFTGSRFDAISSLWGVIPGVVTFGIV